MLLCHLSAPAGSVCLMQEYVREEVAECMDGMLDAVDEALPQAPAGSSTTHNMPAPQPAQTSALLPAPRWAPQPTHRQDASLQTLPNGRCEPVPAVNSSQCAVVPAEASDLEHSASAGAQTEVTADIRPELRHSGPPDSHVHSSVLEAASAADQRNTSSHLVEGTGSPPASSIPNANHGSQQRQQSKLPQDHEEPRLLPPPHEQQQGTQPQLQHSAPVEPCEALLPPPTFALSSRPVLVDGNGPDEVKTEALELASDVQRGPSVPDSESLEDNPVAAATMHPGTDDGSHPQHDGPAHWWPEQTAHQRTASARPDVANGRVNGSYETKHADAMRNGCISSPGAGGKAAGDPADGRRKRPAAVRVVCGGLRATLDLGRMVMVLPDGREMSGNEFERVAGKASAKKWKARAFAHVLDAV